MSQTTADARWQCEIMVVGNNSIPVEGADISFTLDGTPAGSIRNSRGRASILIPFGYAQLEVTASSQGVSQSVILTSAIVQATVALDVPGAAIKAPLPTAVTCPDGTTNHPCIDCIVNGTTIQICA
jgi:hypothetical protein